MCTKEEMKQVMDDSRFSMIEELNDKIDKSVCAKHTTSPETLKMINDMKKSVEKLTVKVDEIHKFYTGAKFMQRSILWIFATLGAVAVSISQIIDVCKKLK